MKTLKLVREFSYHGMKIPDPNPSLTVEQAVRSLAAAYPEFTTAKIEPPRTLESANGTRTEVYVIKPVVDTKG